MDALTAVGPGLPRLVMHLVRSAADTGHGTSRDVSVPAIGVTNRRSFQLVQRCVEIC